jgi:FkbM family methyltransferase
MIYGLKAALHDLQFALAEQNSWVFRMVKLRLKKDDELSVLIDRFARAYPSAFVIQVGANDGMTHDPVHRPAKRYDWKGILLEPQPAVFQRYLKRTYAKYPALRLVNAAIGEQDGEAELFTISFSSDRWATGLARFNKALLVELIRSGKLHKRLRRYGIVPPATLDEWIVSQKIAVRSFDSVLKEFDVKEVDFLVVDTEGFDAEVIRMFDVERYLPKLIVFEDMHIPEQEYAQCVGRLHQNGYQCSRRGPNTIAWRDELMHLMG